MIVGIEGPVLAGKSSLVRMLLPTLAEQGISADACPCFVEAATSMDLALPPIEPTVVTEQVAAVRFYLGIDNARRDGRAGDLLLLDRTAWTLVAHTAALAAVGKIPAVAFDDDTAIALRAMSPRELIYLDVAPATQRLRAAHRDPMPAILLDERFNAAFRRFFDDAKRNGDTNCLWIQGDDHPLAVRDSAATHITRLVNRSR